MPESELKYLSVGELRREILWTAGVDPGDRFKRGSDKGIRKANLLIVAAELQPEGEHYNFADMRLTDLYSLIGEWVGVQHEGTAGVDWTMNRDLLKAIHRELHD